MIETVCWRVFGEVEPKMVCATIQLGSRFIAMFAAIAVGWFSGCESTSQRELEFPGIVETQEVRLGSKVGGRILRILVKEGDRVLANQPLVEFDPAELEAKHMQLFALQDASRAKLDMLSNGPLPEQVNAALSAMQAFEAKLARLTAGWRSEEIDMAKYDVEIWQAEFNRSKAEYDRLNSLRESDSVSLSELDAVRAAMLKSEGQAKSMASRLEMLVKGSRIEDIAEARAELAKAKSDYELIKRGTREEEIRIAMAQLHEVAARMRELEILIQECTLVAPEACLIEVVSFRHGDSAAPNQPVLRVLYDEDLWIKAYVPETQLPSIRLNQTVQVRHDGSKRDFHGTITHISSISEFTPRNVQSPEERHHQVFAIKVRLADSVGVFKSGMAAQIRVPHDENDR